MYSIIIIKKYKNLKASFFSLIARLFESTSNKNAVDTIDDQLFNNSVELALKHCTIITTSITTPAATNLNNENKYKRELAIKILEAVVKNHSFPFDRFKFSQILNQVKEKPSSFYFSSLIYFSWKKDFFDKLLKQFETQSNEYTSLNLIRLIINLLGNVSLFFSSLLKA